MSKTIEQLTADVDALQEQIREMNDFALDVSARLDNVISELTRRDNHRAQIAGYSELLRKGLLSIREARVAVIDGFDPIHMGI